MTIDYRILKILDDCGDTSNIEDWLEVLDGLNPVDETTLVKQGSHAMALGIDADKDAADSGKWENPQNQGDLSGYQHDWVYFWVYLPTLDYLDPGAFCLVYNIGSDVSNRLAFYFTKASLSVGWNLVKCDLDNPSGTFGTVNWTAVDYQTITIYETTDNTHDFTIYVDSIMFVRPFLKGFSLLPIFRIRRR